MGGRFHEHRLTPPGYVRQISRVEFAIHQQIGILAQQPRRLTMKIEPDPHLLPRPDPRRDAHRLRGPRTRPGIGLNYEEELALHPEQFMRGEPFN
jgi:hypothetical protein